jgi:hypothetical protein
VFNKILLTKVGDGERRDVLHPASQVCTCILLWRMLSSRGDRSSEALGTARRASEGTRSIQDSNEIYKIPRGTESRERE